MRIAARRDHEPEHHWGRGMGYSLRPVLAGTMAGLGIALACGWGGGASAQSDGLQRVVSGAPDAPSQAWRLAAGGRIYDKWWRALGRSTPKGRHPAYPASGTAKDEDTWRCSECHGWDYRGRDGDLGKETSSPIKGIRGAQGRSPATIAAILRDERHRYTRDMIADEEVLRVALFVSKGQHDTERWKIAASGKAPAGVVDRGKELFQTVCAVCHGFDGRLLNWGTKEEPAFIGTEASKLPWEVLHKIRNAHPGVAMVSLRALPMADAAAVLAYARTLPPK